MTDSWLNDRQRDGGVDRIPLPQGIDGELRLCGKHAAASRHDAAPWDTVVVLVERHEIDRRYPHYTAWLDGAGDRVLWFPIHDLHAPAIAEAAPVVAEIARRLRGGHLVLMHCAAGMGRAGTMAACVLIALGATADEALRIVATARPGAGPEAGAQRELVAALAADQGGDGPQLYHATVDVPVTPDDVERAAARVGDRVRRTPVIGHGSLTLKLELLQHAGSFKTRGAFNRVLSERHVPAAGLIAASGGNHGAALAYVGQVLELPTEIFIPSTSPELKRRNVERFGASVRVIEGYYDDAQAAADARRAETGALEIHPYDHVATVAGQGTMSRELEQQLDGFDTIVVAAGGGGFIAGQAAWLRERVRIVCVESDTSRCVAAALDAGAPVPVEVSGLAADSLGARQVGAVPWQLISAFVDDAVTVPDTAIRSAQYELWDQFRLVAEPGGAAALAAIRAGAYRPAAGERVVVVVCGSNADPSTVTGGRSG